jgi:predicted HTH transcriptional regulator
MLQVMLQVMLQPSIHINAQLFCRLRNFMTEFTLDLESLSEHSGLEVKKALGKNGDGQIPKDFFASYSAFANTGGGYILLGVEQLGPKEFVPLGIRQISRVQKALWDNLNNRQVVSGNILAENDVSVLLWKNKEIICIRVPRADRKERPVYIGTNPLTGTYRRNYEGDYLCDSDSVKRMLADQIEESIDSRIVEGFNVADLNLETIKAYRMMFASLKPESPWLSLDDVEFLKRVGAAVFSRKEKTLGVTLGGLLMFGHGHVISEVFPSFFLDYQEQSDADTGGRWLDRVISDGTWSGNVFDFFRKVSKKLVQDLKVPFQLHGVTRVDSTPVHAALREALVNCLIHADFSGNVSLRIIKKGDAFEFRNPGTMRISLEDAISGGVSDCRNKNLQKMFRLIGAGDQAGSGVPHIYKCWADLDWTRPSLIERTESPESHRKSYAQTRSACVAICRQTQLFTSVISRCEKMKMSALDFFSSLFFLRHFESRMRLQNAGY